MTEHPTYTDEDVTYLAKTIWGEARGEGRDGMRLVAYVIKNRAQANKPAIFGAGVKGVVLKQKQFSCWNAGNSNCRKLQDAYLKALLPNGADGRMWILAQSIAREVLADRDPKNDPTRGALFYHTTRVNPIWNRELTKVATHGAHVFYA